MLKEQFSIFTAIFIMISLVNLMVCLIYTRYYFKYKHIRAKDITNLWLIFLAGQSQSWGKYFYSIPFYEDTGVYTTLCLTIGYIFQHLLGSCLLFYCLMVRLIKYGAIFGAFSRCKCCLFRSELNSDSWSFLGYKQLFTRKYKLLLVFTIILMAIPMMIFIIAVYSVEAIDVDEDTGYCQTDPNWKLVFICINLIYFVTLVFTLCFVPRYIKKDHFNESLPLRDAVIYTMIVFGVEIWINYREEFNSMPWLGISGLIIFSIHTFIIARLFWYRAFQACRGNEYYESTFQAATKEKPVTGVNISNVITVNKEDPFVAGFITYCQELHSDEVHTITNSTDSTILTKMTVGKMLQFVTLCKEMEALKSNEKKSYERRPIDQKTQNFQETFQKYKEICDKFVNSDVLPLTSGEKLSIMSAPNENTAMMIFQKLYNGMMMALYYEYSTGFLSTDIASRLSDSVRIDREVALGIESLIGSEENSNDIQMEDRGLLFNKNGNVQQRIGNGKRDY